MNPVAFQFINVSKQFGDTSALSNVSLSLHAQHHTAIIGPSGCGKTTLLRLVAGLDSPTSGTILMDGQTASERDQIIIVPHRRKLAMVFQDLALWPNLSVLENVLLGLSGIKISRVDRRSRAGDALARCGIADLGRRKPAQLSGGQQQKVALARAVAMQPAFLLLDEPFAGLDLITKDQLFDEIRGLAIQVPFTVVLVTHDPVEALSLCDHAVVIEDGGIVELGPFATLLQTPTSDLLRRFQQHQAQLQKRAADSR